MNIEERLAQPGKYKGSLTKESFDAYLREQVFAAKYHGTKDKPLFFEVMEDGIVNLYSDWQKTNLCGITSVERIEQLGEAEVTGAVIRYLLAAIPSELRETMEKLP